MTSVFISLLFAHFTGDYPLQPGWLVRAKVRLPGLFLHIFIHILAMIVVFGRGVWSAWPVLLAIAVTHFCIDFVKIRINLARPQWVIVPYMVDQGLHYLTLWVAATWIVRLYGLPPLFLQLPWSAYALGYLLVTYVWFISERILVHAQPDLVKETVELRWPRMLGRAALLSLLLFSLGSRGAVSMAVGLVCPAIFERGKYHCRAFLTDIVISLLVFGLVRAALVM